MLSSNSTKGLELRLKDIKVRLDQRAKGMSLDNMLILCRSRVEIQVQESRIYRDTDAHAPHVKKGRILGKEKNIIECY